MRSACSKASWSSVREFFKDFDYRLFFSGSPQQRLDLLPAAREHILKQRPEVGYSEEMTQDPHERFLSTVSELTKAAGLVSSTPQFQEVRDEVAFFQAVRAGLIKLSSAARSGGRDVDHAVRQIVANAIVSEQVIDVFSAAGLPRPDLSVLSDEFLAEIQHLPHKNLAAAVLERLLRNEIKARRRTSLIQARSFEELLERAVRKYLGRSIEAAQMVDQLIEMARQFRHADAQGAALGLSTEEFAFYEALADNQSAREVLGDKVLSQMAHELTRLVRQNATIDWTQKRSVQAKLRALVKRLLRRYEYPPDAEQKATETVLEQAKLLGINVTDGGSDSPAEPGAWTGAGAAHDSPDVAQRPLPYPIVVFDSLVASQDSGALRVKTRVDGIERAVAFAACCTYAWLRERGGEAAAKASGLLAKAGARNVAVGTWVELAWRLAALLPRGEADPVVVAALMFVNEKGKPSALTLQLQQTVVPYRNKYSHGVVPNEETVLKFEAPMTEVWRRLLEALTPLRDARLVSRAKIVDTLDGGKVEYETREHSGPEHLFRLGRTVVTGKLQDGWTYLLRGEAAPLSLAPFLWCGLAPESGQRDLFLTRAIGLEPGAKGEFMAISSDATVKVKVP